MNYNFGERKIVINEGTHAPSQKPDYPVIDEVHSAQYSERELIEDIVNADLNPAKILKGSRPRTYHIRIPRQFTNPLNGEFYDQQPDPEMLLLKFKNVLDAQPFLVKMGKGFIVGIDLDRMAAAAQWEYVVDPNHFLTLEDQEGARTTFDKRNRDDLLASALARRVGYPKTARFEAGDIVGGGRFRVVTSALEVPIQPMNDNRFNTEQFPNGDVMFARTRVLLRTLTS